MDKTQPRIDIHVIEVEDGYTIYSTFEAKNTMYVAKSIDEVCVKIKEIHTKIHAHNED